MNLAVGTDAVVDAAYMLNYGLRLIGHRIKESQNENMANFKCAFGASPLAATMLWEDLCQSVDPEICLDGTDRLHHFFWALYFMRVYPKGRNLVATLQSCQKTIMYWVKRQVGKIALLKEHKVSNKAKCLLMTIES